MNFVAPDFLPALPELWVLVMACVVLLVDVWLRPDQRQITYRLTQVTLLGAALITLVTFAREPVVTFHGHYLKDPLGDILKLGLTLAAAGGLLYARDYLRDRRDLYRGEYFVLSLFGVLGMLIMVSAYSFLTVYLGLELLSLSLYALVAFNRDSPVSAEAAMKYFVLGALASGLLLYGIAMIYGATGSLHLDAVAAAIAGQEGGSLVLAFGLVFLVVGLAFKLGAVPFHMWVPDVYQGSPAPVTLYLGTAPKLAAFALLLRVLAEGLGDLYSDWQPMLALLAALSLILGNLVAIVQTNLKRMLAYSTIAHVGFILLGVLAATPEGYAAALFYTLTYVLMALAAFGMILVLSRAGFEAEHIDDFRGLNDRSPWLAFLMLLVMMSLAGIPFLVGFYAKLVVLQAIISEGFIGLAILAVVFSVIGAFYYLRVVKCLYFDAPASDQPLTLSRDTQVVLSANGLLLVALGLYPTALLTWCATAF